MSLIQNSNEAPENENIATETDLFGREQGAEIEGLSTVFDFIDNASIKLKYTNNTGIALTLIMEDKNDENQKFSKIVSLEKGKGEIELTFNENDAQYIQKTNPFYPDTLEIQIPGHKTQSTDYKFMRDASFDVILQGSVKTNIDYTLDLTETEPEIEGEY